MTRKIALFILLLLLFAPFLSAKKSSEIKEKKQKFQLFKKKHKTPASEEEIYNLALAYFYGKPTWLAKLAPKQAEKYKNSRWWRWLYYNTNYQQSLELFQKLIYEYPLSKYLKDADFYIAECNYKMKKFDVAIQAYQDFIIRYPMDSRTEYAYFQLGVCHWKQRKKNPLRDQTETQEALRAFEKFIQLYPQSSRRKQAEEYIKQAKELLFKKEIKIADFYFKKKEYWQSALRYHYAWTHYPDMQGADYAIFQEGVSLWKMGKNKDAEMLFEELKATHPQSSYIAQIPQLKQERKKKRFLKR